MALNITNTQRSSIGSEIMVFADVQLDTSYPTGGYFLDPHLIGLITVNRMIYPDDTLGYNLGYDYTNNKIVVRDSTGGSFVGVAMGTHGHTLTTQIDVSVPIVADTGSLGGAPALVQNVYADAAGLVGDKVIVPFAVVPGVGQVAVDMTTGTMNFNPADAVTNVLVTYLNPVTTSVSAGTPAGTVSAGAAAEVPNGTDLSTVVLKLIIIGK